MKVAFELLILQWHWNPILLPSFYHDRWEFHFLLIQILMMRLLQNFAHDMASYAEIFNNLIGRNGITAKWNFSSNLIYCIWKIVCKWTSGSYLAKFAAALLLFLLPDFKIHKLWLDMYIFNHRMHDHDLAFAFTGMEYKPWIVFMLWLLWTKEGCWCQNTGQSAEFRIPKEDAVGIFPYCMILFRTFSIIIFMMTSSNGNIFRVTGPLCGEITGPGEFPAQRSVTWSFDVFFDLRPNKQLSKQPRGWWFEMPSWSLWRQCNVMA